MSPTDRETFLEWHQTKVDSLYTFDLTKELREYCRSDVDVGETFRADMVRILVERGFVRNSNELLEEVKVVDTLKQRVLV